MSKFASFVLVAVTLASTSSLAQHRSPDRPGCRPIRYCDLENGGYSTACGTLYRVTGHILDCDGREIRRYTVAEGLCSEEAQRVMATSAACY